MRKLLIGAAVATGVYFTFKDTMNLFQWFPLTGPKTRLYWMVRDDGPPGLPLVSGGYIFFDIDEEDMQEGDPFQYFEGKGLVVRFSPRRCLHFGIGKLREQSGWSRVLDVAPEEIRKGTDGVWEEEIDQQFGFSV